MILALDYGEKRIGIAVSDESEQYAKGLDFIPNKSEVKKLFHKDFPSNTSLEEINKARKAAKVEAKIEFRKICNKLLHLINCYYPDKILIGLPTSRDVETGEPILGPQAKKVKLFGSKIASCLKQNKIALDIIYVEESLTSQTAEKRLREQGVPTVRIKERIDSESAKILIEEYIKTILK